MNTIAIAVGLQGCLVGSDRPPVAGCGLTVRRERHLPIVLAHHQATPTPPAFLTLLFVYSQHTALFRLHHTLPC